ncbi:hypothetical protein [Corynebacterium lizhenjunii]|uniref:hypothetical protein n=1 Tax=Corynebacterium lizhenjunii TaxID=2709394 RepID=UPI0013EA3234|nr:hypothetical protein [Corynebacterium lizhenjunii]
MWVEPYSPGGPLHPQASKSVFWELKDTVADTAFEKEAWLLAMLVRVGECGFTVGSEATVFFCPPQYAPGAAKLPTAPVSADAAFLTSLFISPTRASRGLEAVLLDATIVHLITADYPAVEAFGFRDSAQATALLGAKPALIGLLPVEILESAGFKVVQEHPATPRLRLDLPPENPLLSAAAVEDLLARALA